MKDCTEISELFVDIVDNPEAHGTAGKRVHDHLASCSECQSDFRWYQVTVQAMSAVPPVSPPHDFTEQLRARLDEIDRPSLIEQMRQFFSSAPYLPLPVGAAALVIVAVMGFSLYDKASPVLPIEINSQEAVANKTADAEKAFPVAGVSSPEESENTVKNSMFVNVRPSLQTMGLPGPASRFPAATYVDTPSPSLADRIGADNLTVESPKVDRAVTSLKQILPTLQGRLIKEQPLKTNGQIVLRIMIPSRSYGDLASELINHGAVEAGAGSDVTPPEPLEKTKDNVLLHIRFMESRN